MYFTQYPVSTFPPMQIKGQNVSTPRNLLRHQCGESTMWTGCIDTRMALNLLWHVKDIGHRTFWDVFWSVSPLTYWDWARALGATTEESYSSKALQFFSSSSNDFAFPPFSECLCFEALKKLLTWRCCSRPLEYGATPPLSPRPASQNIISLVKYYLSQIWLGLLVHRQIFQCNIWGQLKNALPSYDLFSFLFPEV